LDAGDEFGLGHFFRCLSIAEAFLSLGHEVYFLSRNLPAWLQEIARERGAIVAQIASPSLGVPLSGERAISNRLSLGDSSETLVMSSTLGLDVLVLDHYGIDQEWFTNLEKNGPRLLQISDFRSFKGGDYLLDYGFDASLDKHQISENSTQGLLLGPKFAPISLPASESRPNQSLEARESLPVAAIALGSGIDLAFLKAIECEYLDSPRSFSLSILAGDLSTEKASAKGVQWVTSADGLALLLAQSDFAVTSGGVSMYERIASGVPGAVVETAINQRPALDGIKNEGLGSDTFLALKKADARSLMEIIDWGLRAGADAAQRLLLQSTVDFFGPLRVAFMLGAMPPSRALAVRKFESKDSSILLNWANDKTVRANSISSEKISPEEHLLWQEGLQSKGTQIWMFELQGIPFGQVRFARESGKTFISYSIDSLFRGLRFSSEMISIAMREASIGEDIFARAKPANLSSVQVLTGLGFSLSSSREGIVEWVLYASKGSKEKGLSS
jgi:spore coat polysaccharide biosynthesis predicted glycosyltransferase SpsG/RimJ/RimL family protein N-acetyltransferase